MADPFWMLDGRSVWWQACAKAAEAFDFQQVRVNGVEPEMKAGDIGFVRPSAAPKKLAAHRKAFAGMEDRGLAMVQDSWSVATYDDKLAQRAALQPWLPETWVFRNRRLALEFVKGCHAWPLVSKASVGAASANVRILRNAREAVRHVKDVFGRGVGVAHCAEGAYSRQRGYVYFQRFIPHTVTWRVNVIGAGRAVFRRFNYPDRPVAQMGNTEGVVELTPEVEAVLDFANKVVNALGTGWCALDILETPDGFRLLETSLAWPWRADAHGATPIFGTDYQWAQLWHAMFAEIRGGRLAAACSPSTSQGT